jgi:hypothetical protein
MRRYFADPAGKLSYGVTKPARYVARARRCGRRNFLRFHFRGLCCFAHAPWQFFANVMNSIFHRLSFLSKF